MEGWEIVSSCQGLCPEPSHLESSQWSFEQRDYYHICLSGAVTRLRDVKLLTSKHTAWKWQRQGWS